MSVIKDQPSLIALQIHSSVWKKILPHVENQRLSHALLFVGPIHAKISTFVERLLGLLICSELHKPCGTCQNCRWLIEHTHPDLEYLVADLASSTIKIDQIRQLQQEIYTVPKLASRRFIIIEKADQLNIAAMNALLKILEEPPAHVMFILITHSMQTLSATIRSRCQKYIFPDPAPSTYYLTQGSLYDSISTRAQLDQHKDQIILEFFQLFDEHRSPCMLAQRWSEYAWDDLLWFLYLLVAQIIREKYIIYGPSDDSLQLIYKKSVKMFPTMVLWQALQRIDRFIGLYQQGIVLNKTLALEAWLCEIKKICSKVNNNQRDHVWTHTLGICC